MWLAIRDGIAVIEKQTETLLDRVVEAAATSAVSAYEERIAALAWKQALAAERRVSMGRPQSTFEDSFEHAARFLATPWKGWTAGGPTLKRTVPRLAFSDRISYCRNHGRRTQKTTMSFKALAETQSGKCAMVPLAGLEPARCCHQQILRFSRPLRNQQPIGRPASDFSGV